MQKFKARILEKTPDLGRRILNSPTAYVMGMTFMGMTLSLLGDVLIAARLGTTLATDTLIIALSIPRLIETVGREGTRFSLMTLFIETYKKQSKADFFLFFSRMLNLFLASGLAFFFVSYILAPYIITLIGPGLSLEYTLEAIILFRAAIFLVIFAFGATVLEAVLNSRNHFVVASSRNVVVSGFVIAGIILGWHRENISLWIVSGYSLGYCVFFMWLCWYSLKRAELVYSFFSWPDRNYLDRIWRAIFYPTTSMGIRQLSRVVERTIVSSIAPGGVAIYYFAFRLVSAVQSIISISVTTTGLPNISRLVLEGKTDHLLRAIYRQVKRVLVIGLPVSLMIILFHDPIVTILYGHGKVDEASVEQIGLILQILGGALFFWSVDPVFSSALFAFHKYSWVFWKVMIVVVINLSLAWIFAQLMGIPGVAWAVTISAVISTFITYSMLLFVIRSSKESERG